MSERTSLLDKSFNCVCVTTSCGNTITGIPGAIHSQTFLCQNRKAPGRRAEKDVATQQAESLRSALSQPLMTRCARQNSSTTTHMFCSRSLTQTVIDGWRPHQQMSHNNTDKRKTTVRQMAGEHILEQEQGNSPAANWWTNDKQQQEGEWLELATHR